MLTPLQKRIVAVIAIILTIVVAEAVAYFVLPYKTAAYDPATRNHFFRRGWPEYAAEANRDAGTRKIVFVGNSQGFGREILPGQTFTARLQGLFQASGATDVRIYNWSAPAAIAHDLLVLTAKAIAVEAEIVVISTYAENFLQRATATPLSYSALDVRYLLGESNVRRRMPPAFMASHDDIGYVTSFLTRYSSLFRLRSWLQDLASRLDHSKETFWWNYPPKGPGTRPTLEQRATIAKANFFAPRIAYFDHFIDLSKGARSTRVVFVLMPLAKEALASKALLTTEYFNRELTDTFAPLGIDTWDLTWALDQSQFYSHTHFSPLNHDRYATLLFEKLVPLLGID